jgi:hypothetical protein
MPMKLRDRFPSWRNPLYSLPTLRGLVPLAITVYSGYVSFTRGSPAHQWLVVLMSLLTVMHLIESSTGLRDLELTPDPDATVFAGIPAKIRLFRRSAPGPGTPHGTGAGTFASGTASLEVRFAAPGEQSLPEKHVVDIPASGLFRYWRYLRFKEKLFVLPEPLDQGIPLDLERSSPIRDPDELVPIRDPRLLPFRDEKVFLKTGKSVLRAHTATRARGALRIDWAMLQHLPAPQRLQQLSHWVREIEASPKLLAEGLEISTPFFAALNLRNQIDWRRFKKALALASAGGPL